MNARNDTNYERKSYKDAIIKQRCVLVVDGYFEWKYIEMKISLMELFTTIKRECR